MLNLKSAEEQPNIVDQCIKKELEAGKIEGAFEHVHFETRQMSPVGVVPIKEPDNVRIIHHLSFPDGIYSFYTTVIYCGIEDAIRLIKETDVGAYMAKTDIKAAFRIIPLSEDCHNLSVFCCCCFFLGMSVLFS